MDLGTMGSAVAQSNLLQHTPLSSWSMSMLHSPGAIPELVSGDTA